MDIPWGDIVTFGTAGLSAVAAGGSWFAAHKANRTAKAVARIEQDRWHADLTPIFEIFLKRAEGRRATLDVQLVGPIHLTHLDRVAIRIASSDDTQRTAWLPGGPSQEEIGAQVWGPFRFTHGADGADINGHTVAPIALTVGRGRPFSIERTRPPHWQEGDDREARWAAQWGWSPIKLVLECRKEGFAPWVVPYDVERPRPGTIRG
ncbi:hypothetical protein [Streptomyces drozdowiczii]|uniref:hypothetical protein n=1 Tax=Streptomyces drozdowiczii TaxID=202862 RepID=UPI00403D1CDD